MTGRLTAENIKTWLSGQIAESLGEEPSALRFGLISQSRVADGTTVVAVSNAGGARLAVTLCSPSTAPDAVDRAMNMAAQAMTSLGPELGSHILTPTIRGRVEGLSYAVLPYCHGLSESRVLSRLQNLNLRAPVFDWLCRLTARTVSPHTDTSIAERFQERLQHVASSPLLGDAVRETAVEALRRLEGAEWKPRHVLMHGDLWRGNVLMRPSHLNSSRWRDRFVVIDWPGAELTGYAMFDLVRLAHSMRLSQGRLSQEVNRHCAVLGCDRQDAKSYLVAALGHVGLSLGHFPSGMFAQMAQTCYETLAIV